MQEETLQHSTPNYGCCWVRIAKQCCAASLSLLRTGKNIKSQMESFPIPFSEAVGLIVCPAGGTLLLLFLLQIHPRAKGRQPPSVCPLSSACGAARAPPVPCSLPPYSAPTISIPRRCTGPLKKKETSSCFLWAASYCLTANETLKYYKNRTSH